MPLVLNATPNDPTANSFLTVAEFNAYHESRIPVPEWDDVDSEEAMLVMATRLITAQFSYRRKLVRATPRSESYYWTPPYWTGAVATSTQSLPWGRAGMTDRNGNAIPINVIPQELKDATAELALQLAKGDRTLDSDVAVQGITSIKAGSVALSFKDSGIDVLKVIPDIVYSLLVPSWLTEEVLEPAVVALFDVVS